MIYSEEFVYNKLHFNIRDIYQDDKMIILSYGDSDVIYHYIDRRVVFNKFVGYFDPLRHHCKTLRVPISRNRIMYIKEDYMEIIHGHRCSYTISTNGDIMSIYTGRFSITSWRERWIIGGSSYFVAMMNGVYVCGNICDPEIRSIPPHHVKKILRDLWSKRYSYFNA